MQAAPNLYNLWGKLILLGMHGTQELLLALSPKVAQLSGSAEHLQNFVQLSSCAHKPPLSLAGLTSYPEALLLLFHLCWNIWRGKVGRAPPAFHLLQAKVRNGTEHRPGG